MAQEIELLAEEIQELTQLFRDLKRTVMDADTAISAKFTQQIKKSSESVKQNTKLVDRFGNEIVTATKATQQETKATEASTKARQREYEESKRLIDSKMRERSATQDLMREFGMGASSTQLLRRQFEKFGDGLGDYGGSVRIVTAGMEGLAKATTLMASSLYKGQRGATVTAQALTALTKPLTDLGDVIGTALTVLSFIPGIGAGVRLLALGVNAANLGLKTLNKYNELAAEQADALFKSFRELSQVGARTADGMDGVFRMAQTMGVSVAELEQFNALLTSNAKALALMGINAGQGAERFAEVAGGLYKSKLGYQLELLGMSAQEQRESALIYMSIQARTGQMQLKSTQQLIAESGKFAAELDLAAQLTGQTRKEQAAAREAALAEVRFRAARIDAERRGDREEMLRLDAAEKMAAIAKGFGDERGFVGILQAAAGRGALTTPEAVAAEMTYGVSRILQNPNRSQLEMAQLMGESVDTQQKQLAGIIRYSGDISALSTDFVKTADFQKRTTLLMEEANRQGLTGPDALLKVLQTEQGKRIAAGGDTELMVRAGRAQQGAALTMDAVVKTFNGAARLNASASTTFRDAVNQFSRIVGAKPVPGGVPGRGGPMAATGPGFSSGGKPAGATGDYYSRLMQLESGGRNIATQIGGGTSSAFGLYQITENTFKGLVANAPPGSPLRGKSFEDMKTDVNLQRAAVEQLTQSNVGMLSRRGLSSSDAAKYMAHVLGYPMAARVLEANPGIAIEKLIPERSRLNNPKIFENVRTAGELRQRFSDITGGGGYQFGGIASGPKTGYATVLHGTEAIVPLPDGKKIPVEMTGMNNTFQQQVTLMGMQLNRLDDLVTIMRDQTSISKNLLQVARS